METIKDGPGIGVKAETSCSLLEGKVKVKLKRENREIQVPVQIFHKDDAKNGQKLFDWTTGKRLIKLFSYKIITFCRLIWEQFLMGVLQCLKTLERQPRTISGSSLVGAIK